MKFSWEAEDIVCGVPIVQPQIGTTAVISWSGLSGDQRYTISETNTDGKIHHQHKTDDAGELVRDGGLAKGDLVVVFFTKDELADYLNRATYQWVPSTLFSGRGCRFLTDDRGQMKPSMAGMKNLDLKSIT